MSAFVTNLVAFVRVLRSAGIDAPVGATLDLIEALTHLDARARDQVYYACRSLVVKRHEQLPLFDALFDAFWQDHANPFAGRETVNARQAEAVPATPAATAAVAAGRSAEADGDDPHAGVALKTWSDTAALARKDLAEFSADEEALARAALDRLGWLPGLRRTRRWSPGQGPRIDLRRAASASLRTRGELLRLPTRRRRTRPRRLVLLCDVSGSMERYARILLHFAHAVSQRHGRIEVFLFSTGLTRVTRQLRPRQIDRAAAAVTRAVPDWSGGTRIGHALQQFGRQWARRVLREQPVVLLISDGWDCGDPGVLRHQVARLQRSCYRLIWLNPLVGSDGYEPLTRGLQAALPFVDDFMPVRTLRDLADLALHLTAVAPGTRLQRASERV
jgi:uncharacterized protein with von Willebrand factor type A (vWA) domain